MNSFPEETSSTTMPFRSILFYKEPSFGLFCYAHRKWINTWSLEAASVVFSTCEQVTLDFLRGCECSYLCPVYIWDLLIYPLCIVLSSVRIAVIPNEVGLVIDSYIRYGSPKQGDKEVKLPLTWHR